MSIAGLLAVAALASLWLPLFVRWSRFWSAVPDQAYGWAVPALAVFLAWQRWRSRPEQRQPNRAGRMIAFGAAVAGLALYIAALPVLEANPLWPTAQWAAAAGATVVTLAGMALLGGGVWAAHFAFPVLFVSTALAWPTPVQLWVVRVLAGGNAHMAAEIVSALGHPAVVNGNVIVVSSGLVGVDEACSGLRSLQAVWMAGWFFGEFFRLRRLRRLELVGASIATAIAANLARTAFLTWEAAARGLGACDRWHDPAADVEVAAALAVVALLAWKATGRSPAAVPASQVSSASPGLNRWATAVIACSMMAEIGTQAWYLAHERRPSAARVHWELVAPNAAWQPVPVPARAQAILRNSTAKGLAWSDPASAINAWVFVISWDGSASQKEDPEWHDPTICLPSSGAERVADLGVFPLSLGGLSLAFTGYRFATQGPPIDVFFCHWDAGVGATRSEGDSVDLRILRLRRVLDGRRRGDVAHVIFEIQAPTDAAATAWLEAYAPRLLRLR